MPHDGALWTHGYKAYNWGSYNDKAIAFSAPRIASDLNEVLKLLHSSWYTPMVLLLQASCLLAQENGGRVRLDDDEALTGTMPRSAVVATRLNSILAELSKLNKNAKTMSSVEELAEALSGILPCNVNCSVTSASAYRWSTPRIWGVATQALWITASISCSAVTWDG